MTSNEFDSSDDVTVADPKLRQGWSSLRAQFLSRYPLVQVRLYSEKDAILIKRIQHLMDCGFSLKAACEGFLASMPDEGEQGPQSLAEVLERWYSGFAEKDRQRMKLCADCVWRLRQK
jgi:hypothetical protein